VDRLAPPETRGIPTVEEILGRMETPPPPQGRELVRRAYEMAQRCHEGQKRKSGDPYFLHCSRVAWLLAGLVNDSSTIAAGLLHEPEILFLDEPTVGVDPQSRNAIFESVERLHEAGLTVLYTTHYMEEAQRLCHRVAIMDEGRIIALDTPEGLIRSLGGGIIQVGIGNGKSQAVLDAVAQLPSVKTVSRQDGQMKIEAHQAQQAMRDLLDVTYRLDARITALQIMEPNLETVFLHLTGKKLRD
jgi:ABC-type uncharacterized transport system ATPase subunit